jgi:hypothetical protein
MQMDVSHGPSASMNLSLSLGSVISRMYLSALAGHGLE